MNNYSINNSIIHHIIVKIENGEDYVLLNNNLIHMKNNESIMWQSTIFITIKKTFIFFSTLRGCFPD